MLERKGKENGIDNEELSIGRSRERERGVGGCWPGNVLKEMVIR